MEANTKDVATPGAEGAVLFFDIDGTIIWHRKDADVAETVANARPTEGVARAFKALAARGHKAFICTGRPLALVRPPILELAHAGVVSAAGSCISIDGKIVYEQVIPEDILVELVERLCAAGAGVLLEGTERTLALMPAGVEYTRIPNVATVHSLAELRAASTMRFNKFSYEGDAKDKIMQAKDFLAEHFVDYDLGLGVGEMCLKGVDKGTGIARTLELLGHSHESTYGFGDSENDLPMLRAVDMPVAMGNALPSVKAAARYITDSVEDDGVVTALEHFGLI